MEEISRIRKKVKKNDKWGSVRCKRKPNQGRITPQSPHGAVRMSENTGMGIAVIRGNPLLLHGNGDRLSGSTAGMGTKFTIVPS